jgi:hypothetical protein
MAVPPANGNAGNPSSNGSHSPNSPGNPTNPSSPPNPSSPSPGAAPHGHTPKQIGLKVQEPSPTHVGRNIVTLDRKAKQALNITSGDIVEIEGTKKTAAIVWPARTEDEGKDIVRMDNLIRHNAGVGLGEKVLVRPAQFKEAQKVVLAPTQDVRIIASGYERILKKTFIGRPLSRGDNVWITVFGSGFIYRVIETNPRGIVKVTDATQFMLKDEPVKGEIEGVSHIAYEDVGGLGNQVQKVREMIENYLTQKWREGALAGATTKDAFFVKCGIGVTMTAQDILEGRMNVEIGMAAVRPAEFIILKFSHKLQTS